jgi:catechol 2,3-dioxygenase-like lactoylglutathione lyase family enzyme
MNLLQCDHVHLITANVEETVRWYCRFFGATITFEGSFRGSTVRYLAMGGMNFIVFGALAGEAIWLGTRMLDRANVILVSKGVPEAEATAMGLVSASDPAAALALALRQHGPRARINVLYKAAKLICSIP